MCPDSQIISIYLDGELPSPWKEKMESHFSQCSMCREKLENLKRLQEMLRKDISAEHAAAEQISCEPEFIEAARDRVWRKLESRRHLKVRVGLWRRRLSIPLPTAAAAAVVILLLAAMWFRGGLVSKQAESAEMANFIFAAEEEMSGVIPAADINGVLQYLTSNGTDVIILQLPESTNFLRSGDPAIIRAADYSRRHP